MPDALHPDDPADPAAVSAAEWAEAEWADPDWPSLDGWRVASAAGGSRAVFAELQATLDAAEGAQLEANRMQAVQLDAYRQAFALADTHPELYVHPDAHHTESRGGIPVAELAARSVAAELSMRLQLPAATIRNRAHHAAVAHRYLPRLWARFRDGIASYAEVRAALDTLDGVPLNDPHRTPADAARHAAALAEFDDTLAGLAGTIPLPRFRQRARRLRTRLEPPETAAARHQRAHTTRRLILEPAPDGMAWISLYVSAVDAARIHARVHATATHQSGQPGETRTLDQVRADTATDWLTGHGTPTAVRTEILITIPAFTLTRTTPPDGSYTPAELDGHGPIDDDTARHLFAHAPTFLRLITDPITAAPLTLDRTRYRTTTAQRRWLTHHYGTCTRPGCTRPAHQSDLDHLHPWAAGGPTNTTNLAPTCRTDHTLKHHTKFRITRTPDGTITWHTPTGHTATTTPQHLHPPQHSTEHPPEPQRYPEPAPF
ncbi:HNH endonuclease signature motif containing protein [Agromyces sp. NBRC 114283]|uniref:HNH endonuclease signature motif containing protein n=1 Tax=Agromyces sp. NBRC 114283 TaxID=2994521 RepID=UPI0024A47BD6|nr:HNH endonuclease signature motif containing protein [Agromyces sp. NBRC 114283]GLU90031.1 hypothetical protein Agsp01_22860 [Agromyces sp. NBRC 114283]